jgi:RNA polymerase sigma-70 factor (ECF subfamily)
MFREVYDAHFPFVWRSLRRLGVAEDDCADAVQDVFVIVHRRLHEFEGRARITTWIFAICMRVAAARRRAHSSRRETTEAELPDSPDPRTDVMAEVERRRALEMLESILDRMPLEQRTVFVLFELEEMSGDEIAELLGVSVGTVRSRLRLAREVFREAMQRAKMRDQFRFTPVEA